MLRTGAPNGEPNRARSQTVTCPYLQISGEAIYHSTQRGNGRILNAILRRHASQVASKQDFSDSTTATPDSENTNTRTG
eukprot:SAG11_NODE_1705_length_4412_cov_5.951078_3_plen_79_part_00